MKRRGLQLGPRHRLALHAASLALFLSGISWAWIQHLNEAGRAGERLVRLNATLIAVHGGSAMLFGLLLGTLLTGHVRRAWHARKNRVNGVFFLTAVSLLTVSGYALYYLGDENWRAVLSNFHLWLGVIMPALLGWHIWLVHRAARRG